MHEIDNNRAVYLVLLDLSAAFDTIDHELLTSRLATSYGLRGLVSNWFDSYLKGRTNRVSISGTLSDKQSVDFGVPQGSVVGPLIFTFYTKPVADIITHHHLRYHVYADDTQLYTAFDPSVPESSDLALSRLSACISDIKKWMTINKLKLNDQKTEFFAAASPRAINSISNVTLHLSSSVNIEPSKSIRNLGIIFDPTMSMRDHITTLAKSINFHLRNLYRIRKFIDQDTCHHAVRSLILSRLDYGNAILYGITQGESNRLQKLQNRAVRLIFSVPRSTGTSHLLTQLHWLPIQDRILFKLLLYVFKCSQGRAPNYLCELLSAYAPGREGLRSFSDKTLLSQPRARRAAGLNTFSVSGPREWNKLPKAIRESPSIPVFRKKLKTHLFS